MLNSPLLFSIAWSAYNCKFVIKFKNFLLQILLQEKFLNLNLYISWRLIDHEHALGLRWRIHRRRWRTHLESNLTAFSQAIAWHLELIELVHAPVSMRYIAIKKHAEAGLEVDRIDATRGSKVDVKHKLDQRLLGFIASVPPYLEFDSRTRFPGNWGRFYLRRWGKRLLLLLLLLFFGR